MRDQLIKAFQAAEDNAEVKAVILTGAGNRAFGAGQDLNETKTFDADRAEVWMGNGNASTHGSEPYPSLSLLHLTVSQRDRLFRWLFSAIFVSHMLMSVSASRKSIPAFQPRPALGLCGK